MLSRVLLVTAFAVLAAAHVVRTAVVAAFAETRTPTATAIWAKHPDVLRSLAMAEVGGAAGAGQSPPSHSLDRLRQLAYSEPLAPEPFLVHSALAQRGGELPRAERLLVHARDIAPRSAAARFLLADQYFRTGRILPGLAEMSVLGRLIPGAMQQVAPSLAAYAKSAGAAPNLKRILLVYPELEAPLLNQLADDTKNTDLILAIARPQPVLEDAPRWQLKLLGNLAKRGEFARAHAVWAQLSGVNPERSRGLINPGFEKSRSLPPFDWSLESGGSGVAEPADGGLRVLYYGREDAVLASQTMLLAPGRYRLAMDLSGRPPADSRIGWTVTCLPGARRVAEVPLGGRTEAPIVADFEVPSDCAAQQIALRGSGKEFPQTVDFLISDLQLTRLGG